MFQIQMSTWIREKMKVASDESYRDPTNLQTKLQKHQAFEAELLANRAGVEVVCKVSCLSNNHGVFIMHTQDIAYGIIFITVH